jgi:hypothetical protein
MHEFCWILAKVEDVINCKINALDRELTALNVSYLVRDYLPLWCKWMNIIGTQSKKCNGVRASFFH